MVEEVVALGVLVAVVEVGMEACTGRAVPGPARREAKLVVDVYGGPRGGFRDVKA